MVQAALWSAFCTTMAGPLTSFSWFFNKHLIFLAKLSLLWYLHFHSCIHLSGNKNIFQASLLFQFSISQLSQTDTETVT